MDFENDPAADFLSREQEELAGIIDESEGNQDRFTFWKYRGIVDNHCVIHDVYVDTVFLEPNFSELSNDDFSLINNAIQEASAQSDELVDDLAGMSFVSTIPDKTEEVPEKIRLWKIETQRKLEEKDSQEIEAKEALKLAAQNEMAEWAAKYKESMEKTKSFNRSNEQAFESLETPENGSKNIWESITNLCDFNQRGPKSSKDASRMRWAEWSVCPDPDNTFLPFLSSRSIFLQMKVN